MGDRSDIDGLLMGALYGELDAADKTRLEAHLASHPGDRATMDALAETRTRVRDGLAHLAEVDPAPAISTLILQEAARRAPRKRAEGERGVFAWLANVFQPVARHPALAGAMALALVAGTAGVLYENGKVTREEAPIADVPSGAIAAGSASAAPTLPEGRARELDKTDSYQVKLGEQQRTDDGDGKDKDQDNAPADVTRGVATPTNGSHGTAPAKHVASNSREQAKGKGYVEVTTLDRQPKQLDDQGLAQNGMYARGAGGGGAPAVAGHAAGAGQGMGSGAASTGSANAITAGDNVAAAPAPTPKAPAAGPGAVAYDPSADAKLTEWAKVQHQRLLALVKSGDCVGAGRIGSDIATKAPEYYAAFVENDRGVRACKQYIDQDKRKKANEQYKSRARNSYEPDLEAPAAAQ